MKKSLLVIMVVAVAVVVSLGTVSAVSAQGLGQGDGTTLGQGGRGNGGFGNRGTEIENPDVHALEVAAWSKALGITTTNIDARLEAGETMSQIALSAGVTFDEFWTLKTRIKADVADQALAAGYITAEEAQLMQQSAARRGGMGARGGARGTGLGVDGTCTGLGVSN